MRKVRGVGFSDLGYSVQTTTIDGDGKVVLKVCPYYDRWKSLIERCYSGKYRSYADVTVCDDWLYASKFVEWMKSQIWLGLELDKDLLNVGNKVYSPESARFVPKYLNLMLSTSSENRGEHPIGVHYYPRTTHMVGTLSKPFQVRLWVDGKRTYLGMFSDPYEAHKEWQKAKIKAMELQLVKYRKESCYLEEIDNSITLRIDKIRDDYLAGKETLSV